MTPVEIELFKDAIKDIDCSIDGIKDAIGIFIADTSFPLNENEVFVQFVYGRRIKGTKTYDIQKLGVRIPKNHLKTEFIYEAVGDIKMQWQEIKQECKNGLLKIHRPLYPFHFGIPYEVNPEFVMIGNPAPCGEILLEVDEVFILDSKDSYVKEKKYELLNIPKRTGIQTLLTWEEAAKKYPPK